MQDRSKIFLSYSRTDQRVASALARDLRQAGVEVWMDQEISVGERWSTAIQTALETSYAMVLVLSPDSMASPNVEDEFTYFLDARKPIVPVMVRETKLHFQLHRIQWIDFTQGDRETAYHALIRALYKVGVEFSTGDDPKDPIQNSIISQLLLEIDTEKRSGIRRRALVGLIAGLLAVIVLLIVALVALPNLGEENETPEIRPTVEFVSGRIDRPDVVLYEQPSRDSLVLVNELPDQSPIIIRQKTPDERFYYVEYGRDRGFVLARDVLVADVSQIGLYIAPTPQPTATATQFMTATPTVTPSPTPEQVGTDVAATSCIISVASSAAPKPALLGPSAVLFSTLDTVKPGESFLATAQANSGWLYIGIGWVDRNQDGIFLNSDAACSALPVADNLGPSRIRPFIKDLPLADNLPPRQSILTTGLALDSLRVAQAWNGYGGLLSSLSELLSLDEAVLVALIVDEANNLGNDLPDSPNGMMAIRFEADLFETFISKAQQAAFDTNFYIHPQDPTLHQFRLNKEDSFQDYHGNSALEWQAFRIAREIDESAAIRALRFGETGLLGDAFAQIGYVTPQEMYAAYLSEALDHRVVGKLDYIKNNAPLLESLRNGDWGTFAALYDGRVGVSAAAQMQSDYQLFLGLPR